MSRHFSHSTNLPSHNQHLRHTLSAPNMNQESTKNNAHKLITYLSQCGISHYPPTNSGRQIVTLTNYNDICDVLNDGYLLCDWLRQAFKNIHKTDKVWFDKVTKLGVSPPGYKFIIKQNQISQQFMLEENINLFLKILDDLPKDHGHLPKELQFRADELYALVDMHNIFKAMAYLSNNQFYKECFPRAKPFTVSSRTEASRQALPDDIVSDVYGVVILYLRYWNADFIVIITKS